MNNVQPVKVVPETLQEPLLTNLEEKLKIDNRSENLVFQQFLKVSKENFDELDIFHDFSLTCFMVIT